MKKLKVVFDTNIYVSASMFPGGLPEELLKIAFSGGFLLGVSKEILEELSIVYLKKFHLSREAVNAQIKRILSNSELVEAIEKVTVVRSDKSDNKILECAVAYKADVLVSGDSHLLDIKKYKGIAIVKPAELMNLYRDEGTFVWEKRSKYLTNGAVKVKDFKYKKTKKSL